MAEKTWTTTEPDSQGSNHSSSSNNNNANGDRLCPLRKPCIVIKLLCLKVKLNMQTFIFFLVAALGEISGCYAFWAWLRLGKSIFWIIPGILALMIYAFSLTKVDTSNAGRAYAAYGGFYILLSLFLLWLVEGVKPDKWDLLGVTFSLVGTIVILFSPHRQ